MEAVAVIGGGVIGLTTGIRLREAGYSVVIYSRDQLLSTTSANSGAIWGPFLSGLDTRVEEWSYRTADVLTELSANPESGVVLTSGTGAQDISFTEPWWVESHETCRTCSPPDPYSRAWTYSVPIIDMPKYLMFLANWFIRDGGIIRYRLIHDVRSIPHAYTHVVIAAGLGSATLVRDSLLVPSRGQLVVVRNPGLRTFFAERGDGPDLTYILPQGDKVVLGGTAESGVDSDIADRITTQQIIDRCSRIEPSLQSAPILGTRVGIRPCREEVRLDHGTHLGRHVVYNYGHGGSGVSVAWGCAEATTDIINSCVSDQLAS